MNWYRRAIEDEWRRFPPNAQREFPFMHEPGYNQKALPYLGDEAYGLRDYDINYNLYHVTTNLQGVISSGRLKSREELGTNVGLGGGPLNEAADLVSTTYSKDRAVQIYDDIKFMSELVAGRVPASQVFFSFDFDEADDRKVAAVLEEWLDYKDIEPYFMGEMTNEDLGALLNGHVIGGESIYEFWQRLENIQAEVDMELAENADDLYHTDMTGFTAPYGAMTKINPSQVAILQLVARKGARTQHVPMEMELRFRPEDLRVVRVWQP